MERKWNAKMEHDGTQMERKWNVRTNMERMVNGTLGQVKDRQGVLESCMKKRKKVPLVNISRLTNRLNSVIQTGAVIIILIRIMSQRIMSLNQRMMDPMDRWNRRRGAQAQVGRLVTPMMELVHLPFTPRLERASLIW